MRRPFVIALVLLVVATLFVGAPSMLTWVSSSEEAPTRPEPELYYPEGSESGFWPYLSDRKNIGRRSPINLVVRGDAEEVARLLVEASDGEWNETSEEHFEETLVTDDNASLANDSVANETLPNETVDNATDGGPLDFSTQIPWSPTAGAVRYAYVDPGPDGDTYWTTETIQVDDGDYYGHRFHIRLYEAPDPDDEWVAMQAHTEHFDWFTLRHRVDGARAAQARVEADLMNLPQVDHREDVQRIYLANSGGTDSDGWATLVDLAGILLAPLLVGLSVVGDVRRRLDAFLDRYVTAAGRRKLHEATERVTERHLGLILTVAGLLLGVRFAGVALERHAGFLSMHAIAALLYPFIALGIPIGTYAWAHGITRRLDAAVTASLALAAAVWIDYGLVGVNRLALDVVLQRMLVVVALGLIAGGAARRAHRDRHLNGLLVVGVTTWVVVLVATLLGYL